MATFNPSPYQKVVYTFITKGHGNGVIDAVAGSGKSTTIVNALKIIPNNQSVLFLAFNKAIVEELKVKVGKTDNVEIRTLHSLGASVLSKSLHCSIDGDKYKAYVNEGIRLGVITPNEKITDEEVYEYKNNIMSLIDLGRGNLIKDIRDLLNLSFKHCLDIKDNEIEMAFKAIRWGESQLQTIDFTDMIYFPNVKNISMPKYDWVFIDECQDLNAAQREMFLKCLKPTGRFIAVGDPRQSIYGFAGADAESFNILKSVPNTKKLPLSICYRCDTSIIELAQRIVPQIKARENAEEGTVKYDAKIADVKDGDMILCRTTAPLVDLCMKYISTGVKAYVKGRDIGSTLVNFVKKTNRKKLDEVFSRLEIEGGRIIGKIVAKTKCSQEEAKENEIYISFKDKVDVLDVLSQGLITAEELINRIQSIFRDDERNGICLSTIHKSKGLESDRVFLACPEKMYPKWAMKIPFQQEQEKNLEYVAITRAKHFLGYIDDYHYDKK